MSRYPSSLFVWVGLVLLGQAGGLRAVSPHDVTVDGSSQTRIPLGWFITVALCDLRNTHARDLESLGDKAQAWIKTLDPTTPNLGKSLSGFSEMIKGGAFVGESKTFVTQLQILYALTSNNSDYIAIGTKESPLGKIAGLTISMGPKSKGPGSVSLGASGTYGFTLKPRIDDYEVSKDGSIAWARFSVVMTLSTGGSTGSEFLISSDRVWIGVESGKEFLLSGGKLPIAVSDPTGPFLRAGLFHYNERDPKKRFPMSAEKEKWPPRRVPTAKATLGKPIIPPPAVKTGPPRVKETRKP